MGPFTMTVFIGRDPFFSCAETEVILTRKTILTKNYAKAFKRLILLAVVLAVVTAAAVPLSLSRQISDLSALEQTKQEETLPEGGEHSGHADREELWKSRITPLSAANYAILGGLAVLWLVLLVYYWLLVMAWLYKNAVNEGMNRSLWPILGLFTNLLAVLAFLIVRDDPRRVRPQTAQ